MARLGTYRAKRDFTRTPEPRGGRRTAGRGLAFVIQKHAATRLHYDFRLELDGTLKSWAVPKGPSLDPADKRLAVHVEDHPIEYGGFEGVIPKGQYGGGTVLLWDRGEWIPEGDPAFGYRKGHLAFELVGEKLGGSWHLVRMKTKDGDDNWILLKQKDEAARPGVDITAERPESVATGRTIEQIGAARDKVWHSDRPLDEALEVAVEPPDPSALPKSRRGKLPDWVEPELATRVTRAPAGDDWLHEIKFDGYRALCRIARGKARFQTRRGLDWSEKFAPLPEAAASLPVRAALLDGEVVALRPDGKSSFQALQEALSGGGGGSLTYLAFDLLHLDGYDLTATPLAERKAALAALLAVGAAEGIRYSDHVVGHGPAFLRQACDHELEGIVSKRADAPYRSGRGRDWVKTKCTQRQDFVIGGWTDPEGSRAGLGALLLGVHEDDELRYAGRVGTGFDARSLRSLRKRLDPLAREEMPFAGPLERAVTRGAHWVEPKLVAEVEFTEWTRDDRLRHPSFQGLREDIPAAEVVRERAVPPPAEEGTKAMKRSKAAKPAKTQKKKVKAAKKASAAKPARAAKPVKAAKPAREAGRGDAVAGVRLTNPGRVLYPGPGITKLDLARYYVAIADHVLPHLADRPLTLVRCPRGVDGECFYQKHADETIPESVLRVTVDETDGEPQVYGAIDSLEGLIALVQLGTLEFHVWNAKTDDLERPDRLIFDLDPGPGVEWRAVVDAARRLRERLGELGLAGFVKTTGGKGLHVEVPLVPEHDWEAAKTFSLAVVRGLERASPKAFTTIVTKARRKGKIYLDYLRNARGATAIAAYSTRARPTAPVATPLRWEELGRAAPDRYTVQNLARRLGGRGEDPWTSYDDERALLTPAIEAVIEEAG